jgi:phosphoglycerate kinase
VAIWIGAVSINNQTEDLQASNLLARTFADITQDGCLTIVGGIEPMSALKREGLSSSVSHICRGGAAFIEFLKGANLPGVSALDFVCLLDTFLWYIPVKS